MVLYKDIEIKWLGHASFKIKRNKIIYIDPFDIAEKEKADIILITHEHYDHCSVEDVKKIIKNDTIIFTVSDCAKKLGMNVKLVKPGDKIKIENIEIEAVPSYNINKQFHPKSRGWVGFILNINGVRIYHAGDTDFIPEMKDIKVDIALVPIGGTYTMNYEEAAHAVEVIKPKIVIPMHYGKIVGSKEDVLKFKKLLEGKDIDVIFG